MEPVALAVPEGTTGTAGVVLLTKIGGAGVTDGLDVTMGVTTGTEVATSAGEVATTGVVGTTGTEVATSAGEVGTAVTGLVTVQGQLVIVRVVAWKGRVLAFSRLTRGFVASQVTLRERVSGLPQSQRRLMMRARTRWRMGRRW